VYLPNEDAMMLDRIPEEQRTPGANFEWEMRNVTPPPETERFHPLWISYPFLKEARVENGLVISRELALKALYIDCDWMDADSLAEMHRFSAAGARLIWKRRPKQPGRRQSHSYDSMLNQTIVNSSNAIDRVEMTPLLEGDDLPPYWARVVSEDLLLFFAHPAADQIRYPMPYGFSATATSTQRRVTVRWKGWEWDIVLDFEPNQSVMLAAAPNGTMRRVQLPTSQSFLKGQ
jgi:hypothetical protein